MTHDAPPQLLTRRTREAVLHFSRAWKPWPSVARIAVCVWKQEPIEVELQAGQGSSPMRVLDAQQEWKNALSFSSTGNALFIPTRDATMVLTRDSSDIVVVFECRKRGEIGVVGVLAEKLAGLIGEVISACSETPE